jgi:hypothetical protein
MNIGSVSRISPVLGELFWWQKMGMSRTPCLKGKLFSRRCRHSVHDWQPPTVPICGAATRQAGPGYRCGFVNDVSQ